MCQGSSADLIKVRGGSEGYFVILICRDIVSVVPWDWQYPITSYHPSLSLIVHHPLISLIPLCCTALHCTALHCTALQLAMINIHHRLAELSLLAHTPTGTGRSQGGQLEIPDPPLPSSLVCDGVSNTYLSRYKPSRSFPSLLPCLTVASNTLTIVSYSHWMRYTPAPAPLYLNHTPLNLEQHLTVTHYTAAGQVSVGCRLFLQTTPVPSGWGTLRPLRPRQTSPTAARWIDLRS